MKETIYLIGQISPGNRETYEWRKRFIKKAKDLGLNNNVEIINPCSTKFDTNFKKNGYEHLNNEKVNQSIELLVSKGYMSVMRSSIGVLNLYHYDPNRPYIGTFFEAGWYYADKSKNLIGIFDLNAKLDSKIMEITSKFRRHPFVRNAVDVWVKDEQEAAEFIKLYYT